jgi:hypothetical protein
MTKSELRQMIREVLKEELSLRENSESTTNTTSNTEVIAALNEALSNANFNVPSNVLIMSPDAGRGVVNTCKNWARSNNIQVIYIDCRKTYEQELELMLQKVKPGTVLFLDEYHRASSQVKDKLFDVIKENKYGQLFTIAYALTVFADITTQLKPAEKNMFDIQVTLN